MSADIRLVPVSSFEVLAGDDRLGVVHSNYNRFDKTVEFHAISSGPIDPATGERKPPTVSTLHPTINEAIDSIVERTAQVTA